MVEIVTATMTGVKEGPAAKNESTLFRIIPAPCHSKALLGMLYLFDLDGTLISSYMDSPGRDYDRWHVLPKRREVLNNLIQDGNDIAIVTNQGGVAFGHITPKRVDAKLKAALERLGLTPARASGDAHPPQVYVAMHDVRGKPPFNNPAEAARRKPSPAMILEAIEHRPLAAVSGVLYVGDRPEDEEAAKRAGVDFTYADKFFNRTAD
ncbi:MAG: D,D-heptose 1,7-bisphosphate phosphatase [Chloroflexi bacterium]|nr:D,D-heptose 1,7-bisphosphate phosphatase [Chloroflexota bacterium]